MLLSEPNMQDLVKIVVPKVTPKWKDLAYSMGYDIATVSAIRIDSHNVEDSCRRLFEDWLSTDRGSTPKTYRTLLRCIKEVDMLTAASEEIEMELINGKETAT